MSRTAPATDDGAGEVTGLDRLSPARFMTFEFPNPSGRIYSGNLRVAVLDSPLPSPSSSPPLVAAMLVPPGRQDDWIFSTASGHLQLLLSSSSSGVDVPISRLILVGDLPSSPYSSPAHYARPHPRSDPVASDSIFQFQQHLLPLLLALSPKSAYGNGIPEIPYLSFEDSAVHITRLETLVGPVAGEMVVEDVELQGDPPERRRRLRFKSLPNLLQSQVRLESRFPCRSDTDGPLLRPVAWSLVQPYLAPMVAGLSLAAPAISRRVQSGSKPRALCVGVGGGALLMCLRWKLGFDVLGIEADEVVLGAARRHFGLVEDESLKVCVGDGIEVVKCLSDIKNRKASAWRRNTDHGAQQLGVELFANCSSIFHAIMVDLDSGDAMNGVCAPPLEITQPDVLLALRAVLHKHGTVVINVIPPDRSFYDGLIDAMGRVFVEMYELDVGNGENFVLAATASPVEGDCRGNAFSEKLQDIIGQTYIYNIKKL